jgi:hypothetical protein
MDSTPVFYTPSEREVKPFQRAGLLSCGHPRPEGPETRWHWSDQGPAPDKAVAGFPSEAELNPCGPAEMKLL